MPLDLGAAFPPLRREEPEQPRQVDVADLRAEQLLSALAALQEALSNMPAPVVNVAEPDLTAIVQAVTELKGPASAEDIAAAIKAELDPSPQPTVEPVLRDLTAALEKLDFRLKGLNTGGGGTVPSTYDIRDRIDRVLGVVTGPLTDTQLRTSPVVTQRPVAFYASAAGGRIAYNITTQLVNFTTGGEQNLGALVNPAGSGKDLHLDLGEFGSSMNTTFRRYRNSTVTPTGTPISANNMGGGSVASVAQMYVGGTSGSTFTRSGGTVSKTAHIAAFQQYLTMIEGKAILRPGQSLSWTILPSSNVTVANPMTASIFFEFFELNAA